MGATPPIIKPRYTKEDKLGYTVPIRPPRNERKEEVMPDDIASMDQRVHSLLLRDRYSSGEFVCYCQYEGDSHWVRIPNPDFLSPNASYRLITHQEDEVLTEFHNQNMYDEGNGTSGNACIIRQLDTTDRNGNRLTERMTITSIPNFFRTYKRSARYFYSGSYRTYTRGDGSTFIVPQEAQEAQEAQETAKHEEAKAVPSLGISRPKKSFKDRKDRKEGMK